MESLGATPYSNEEVILAVRHAWIKKRPDRSQGSSHKLFAQIIRLGVEPTYLSFGQCGESLADFYSGRYRAGQARVAYLIQLHRQSCDTCSQAE
jgi:hypothetical protein